MHKRSAIVAMLLCLGMGAGCASDKGSSKGTGTAVAETGGDEKAAAGDDSAYLASVKEKVEAGMDEVQECFDKVQVRDKTLSGKVRYEWTIRSEGNVDLVEVKNSTMNNGQVEECIKRAIGGWSFPAPPRDNFTVNHTFEFAEKTN
ncbi:MAG: AgmX/PglI C-terminal domain-containing protein [Deltaproteobacteria bacterium]|nr:AgmX/PglI C-terminal domain-containing protein [Deltaproteobacteria bacterium]